MCIRDRFYSLKEDKALYPHTFLGDAAAEADWPPYAPTSEDENTIQHVRYEYAALLSKCDRYLGKVLDMMDQYHLWDDTMLIVNGRAIGTTVHTVAHRGGELRERRQLEIMQR